MTKISGSTLLAVGAIAVLGAIGAIKTSSIGVAQDAPASPPQSTAATQNEGSVSNVFDVPGYTYVEVETADGNVWAAAPSVSVEVGDTVSFSTGMAMRDFYSKTLQREFEVIYFVDRFISNGGTTSIDNEAAAAHGSMDVQEAAVPVEGIRKADGGYTVDGSTNQDLIVPTDATAAVNDVVLVEGELVINMDLGQGYVLPAVLQDAEVTIE